MALKRLPIVPVDSSAARIPLPGAAIALAFSISSAAKGLKDIVKDTFAKQKWVAMPANTRSVGKDSIDEHRETGNTEDSSSISCLNVDHGLEATSDSASGFIRCKDTFAREQQ